MLFAGAASVTTHIHMAAEFQAQTCVYICEHCFKMHKFYMAVCRVDSVSVGHMAFANRLSHGIQSYSLVMDT